mmetsp:Transcript_17107/g.25919  ORF Transcript_17107/g.25919 Transcript_17107/m.25919 type:complete len:278 (+) Transcript_17107:125-958(+)
MFIRNLNIPARKISYRVVTSRLVRRQNYRNVNRQAFSSIADNFDVPRRHCLAMGPRQKRMEATTSIAGRDTPIYESDLIVVLDMDECMIHSKFSSASSNKYAYQTHQTSWEKKEGQLESFQVRLPEGDIVDVNQRPHLHDFLETISGKYETHVFTAAMEVYAKPVLDILDPNNKIFDGRWYRDSCSQTKDGAFVKDLGVLNKNASRMVLVDNNPMSFLANPSNGILVSSFYDDPSDRTLLAVLNLLEELEKHEDVRPILDDRFGLKTALKEVAGGMS